ncbi:MAG TPA: pirin family protein [Candidatus Binataceae bacterium]|nr:pirin family protein [Candidatus Binataceae bacterium]
MITIRKAGRRGHTALDWLDSWHTFSFGDYHDPAAMGFSVLRVINDDTVAARGGFPTHPHNNMEIVTWVLSGALEHRDSMGNGSVIRPGDAQRMTAGTGVTHSEFNASKTAPVHFLQMWVIPQRRGLAPGYEQRSFAEADRRGVMRLIASPDGAQGSIRIHQDTRLFDGVLSAGASLEHPLDKSRKGWLHVARGDVKVSDSALVAGDGAAVENESALRLAATGDCEVLLFDLP